MPRERIKKKTTLRNITIKLNVDPNSSKPSTYVNERISSNVVIVLRRQCDDGWTKKLGVCAKSTTVRQVMMSSMSISNRLDTTAWTHAHYITRLLEAEHKETGVESIYPRPRNPR